MRLEESSLDCQVAHSLNMDICHAFLKRHLLKGIRHVFNDASRDNAMIFKKLSLDSQKGEKTPMYSEVWPHAKQGQRREKVFGS